MQISIGWRSRCWSENSDTKVSGVLRVIPLISLRELIAASHAIEEAEEIIQSVKGALKDWQKVAKRLGAQERDINLLSQRFITE